jgi:hypothetical protein
MCIARLVGIPACHIVDAVCEHGTSKHLVGSLGMARAILSPFVYGVSATEVLVLPEYAFDKPVMSTCVCEAEPCDHRRGPSMFDFVAPI